MKETKSEPQGRDAREKSVTPERTTSQKPAWQPPKMEDVSEQVMAQPYIRFT